MGAARITKTEMKRAIDAGKECGAKSVTMEARGIRIEYNLTGKAKSTPANIWDEKLGLNTIE